MFRVTISTVLAGVLVLSGSSALADAEAQGESPSVSLQVGRARFSPNGDGRGDTTRLSVSVDLPAEVRLRIVDRDGKGRRSWTSTLAGGDTLAVTWDGTGSAGRTLPDGPYTVEATVVGIEGTPRAARRVAIDTVAPRVVWEEVKPEPSSGTVRQRFSFRVRDADKTFTGKLSVWDATGRRIGKVRDFSLDARTATVSWSPPRALMPGTYVTRIRLVDRAGNVGHATPRAWRIHRSMKGRVIERLEKTGRFVALTFDDCHEADAWRRILNVLGKRKLQASFFCPGEVLSSRASLARRSVIEGHSVGSHGWDHARLTGRSDDFIRSRLLKDRAAWWRYGGATSAPFFRPPYGAYNAQVVRIAGETSHPRVIMWDVDPQDWRRPGAAVIARRVVDEARPGSIVVLHTIGQTADALPRILDGLRAKGLTPVSLDRLFQLAG